MGFSKSYYCGPCKPLYSGDTGDSLLGFEYQLMDDATHPDAKFGPIRMSGSLYQLIPRSGPATRPAGEFNHSRIVVRGNHLEHWLNALRVVFSNVVALSR